MYLVSYTIKMSQENSMFHLILLGGFVSVIKAILHQFFVLIPVDISSTYKIYLCQLKKQISLGYNFRGMVLVDLFRELLLLQPNLKYMHLFCVLYALRKRLIKISKPERCWSHPWKRSFLRSTQENPTLSSQTSSPQCFSLPKRHHPQNQCCKVSWRATLSNYLAGVVAGSTENRRWMFRAEKTLSLLVSTKPLLQALV